MGVCVFFNNERSISSIKTKVVTVMKKFVFYLSRWDRFLCEQTKCQFWYAKQLSGIFNFKLFFVHTKTNHKNKLIPSSAKISFYFAACHDSESMLRPLIEQLLIYFCLLATVTCSDGWHEYNGYCYYLSTYNLTWFEANDYCQDNEANLTSILNKEEEDYITGIS